MSTRRTFFKNAGLVAGMSLIGAKGWTKDVPLNFNVRPQADKVRQNVTALDPNGPVINAYKTAITAMQALPDSDPLSWTAQAKIHLDFCPHGNWFFLPWHRAYLYYFEDIIRKMSGYEDFALPYWNWTTSPQIPAVFWGNNNPLNHPRVITENQSIPAEFVGQTVIDDILDLTDFQEFASYKTTSCGRGSGFSGNLESTPHNNVHGIVGDDMGTYWSPLDPIFWCHHANCDRLWVAWNAKGNQDTNDPDWLNCSFDQNFVDRNGTKVNIGVSQVLTTPPLGYVYDDQNADEPVATVSTNFTEIPDYAISSNAVLTLTRKRPSSRRLKAPSGLMKTFAASSPTMESLEDKKIRLFLEDVVPPQKEDFAVRVFINCPYLSKKTPINDPHYVGTFALFASNHGTDHHGGHTNNFALDLTKTLKKLRRIRQYTSLNDINVQMVMVPYRKKTKSKIIVKKHRIAVFAKD